MKKIIFFAVSMQFLLSIQIYKEISIDKAEINNLNTLNALGIDVDHYHFEVDKWIEFALPAAHIDK